MDAWNLCDKLGKIVNQDEIGEILLRYENERIPIGSSEIIESRENAERFHSANSLTIFFRNTIMKIINLKIHFDEWFYK